MHRNVAHDLTSWSLSPTRKPLILYGARQVGKTYLLKEFGREKFRDVFYFNFEKRDELQKVFLQDLNPSRILSELEVIEKKKFNPSSDILIFDEIQACPRALTSLKYFCEDRSDICVANAGSLLGVHLGESSFPVGKVDIQNLYPMTFEEFLIAADVGLAESFQKSKFNEPLSSVVHEKLWDLWKFYLICGGLPEAVSTFIQFHQNKLGFFEKIRTLQDTLINNYLADVAKHSGKVNSMHIERIWRQIPAQMTQSQDGNSKKFRFVDVISGITNYSRLAGPIDWLAAAKMIIKTPIANRAEIPVTAFTKENKFKVFLFDVGLLGGLGNIPPESIHSYDYGMYKGFFAENFVLQELVTSGLQHIVSWEEGSSEIEFLFEISGRLIPVEVKSGMRTKTKSLDTFDKKYRPKLKVIFSGKNLNWDPVSGTLRCPIYLAGKLKSFLKAVP